MKTLKSLWLLLRRHYAANWTIYMALELVVVVLVGQQCYSTVRRYGSMPAALFEQNAYINIVADFFAIAMLISALLAVVVFVRDFRSTGSGAQFNATLPVSQNIKFAALLLNSLVVVPLVSIMVGTVVVALSAPAIACSPCRWLSVIFGAYIVRDMIYYMVLGAALFAIGMTMRLSKPVVNIAAIILLGVACLYLASLLYPKPMVMHGFPFNDTSVTRAVLRNDTFSLMWSVDGWNGIGNAVARTTKYLFALLLWVGVYFKFRELEVKK